MDVAEAIQDHVLPDASSDTAVRDSATEDSHPRGFPHGDIRAHQRGLTRAESLHDSYQPGFDNSHQIGADVCFPLSPSISSNETF